MASWDYWTVSKPCLVPMVVVRTSQVAGLKAGGEGSEGTIAAPLHRQPLRLGHLNNLARPMAAGEPVTARVQFLAEAARGFREGLSPVRFALGFHEQKPSDGENPCPNHSGANPPPNSASPNP